MTMEVAISKEPEASRRAGIQNRARNLATKELLNEVMKWSRCMFLEKGRLKTHRRNIKHTFYSLMLG